MNNWDLTGVYKLSKKHKKSVKALNKRFLCEGKSNFHRYRTICDTSPINYYRIEITDKNSDVIKFGNNFLNIPDDTKISDKLIIRSKPLLSFPFPDNRYVSKRNKSWIINPGFMPGNDDSPIMIFHKNIFETTYVLWLDIETVDKMNEINIYNKILCNNIDWERAVTKGYIQKNEGKFYVNNSEFTRVYKKREKYIINAKRLDLNNPALNTGYINNEQNRIIPRFSCLPHK